MASKVCGALIRPETIYGIEWRVFYMILLADMLVGFSALWGWHRLLLLPFVHFIPYAIFRWAGAQDPQWSEVYLEALADRKVFLAHSDPATPEPKPGRVLFRRPRFIG